MEFFLNLRDGKGWGFDVDKRLDRESMESNLRHAYQASLLGLFFHVTLTPNSLLSSCKSNRLSYPCKPCVPSIPLYIYRPSGYYKVRIEDLYLALRNVIKLYYASLKSRFSKVQSCLNILNEFERHQNHTQFSELYVPIE